MVFYNSLRVSLHGTNLPNLAVHLLEFIPTAAH